MEIAPHPPKEVIFLVLTANTPFYLFKRVREERFTKSLIDNNPVQTLAELYKAIFTLAAIDVNEISLAYSILGAFSLLPPDKSRQAFALVDLTTLRWGQEFSHFSETVNSSTNIIQVTTKIDLTTSISTPTHHTNTKSDLCLAHRPTITSATDTRQNSTPSRLSIIGCNT